MKSRSLVTLAALAAFAAPAAATERASFPPPAGWHFVNKMCCSTAITLIGVWQENDTPTAGQVTFVRETTPAAMTLSAYVASVTKALKVPITSKRTIALCDGRRAYELHESITTAYGPALAVQVVAAGADPAKTFYTATYARPADQPDAPPAIASLHALCIRAA